MMSIKVLKNYLSHGKKAWYLNHINDIYVKKANQHNYRSRAAFKLLQLVKKHPLLIQSLNKTKKQTNIQQPLQSSNLKYTQNNKLIDNVLDLGCAPGSWSQVLKQLLPHAKIVAVDLLQIKPIKGVDVYKCDARSIELHKIFKQKYGQFQLIVSDMAPNFDGDAANTHQQILQLNSLCVQLCYQLGASQCSLFMKSVHGEKQKSFFNFLNNVFTNVYRQKPSSSRSQSIQFFYVCHKLKKVNQKQQINLVQYLKSVCLNVKKQLQAHAQKKNSIKKIQEIKKQIK